MVEFSPDGIAQRTFRTTLRGFDQSEVREFLASLAAHLDELRTQRDQLDATLHATDATDLKDEIETVSREIHSVLEAARSAAETMRERAAAEAARWRSEAIAEAEQTRRMAHADAEHLRTDAWTTSENLLTQAQREASRIHDEAEKESMRLVGEAEREAHRTLGSGRREAEEVLRSARMEAEKLVLDARASHDEIIETANRKAEVAQERTRALEERRDELRRELDSVRAAIAAVESELDERREALGLTAIPEETQPEDTGEKWTPGETVRVVRPGHGEAREEPAVISEPRPRPEPTPELRVLTPEELRSRQGDQSQPSSPSPDVPADEVLDDDFFSAGVEVEEVETVTIEEEVVVELEPEPEPLPEAEPTPQPEPEPTPAVEVDEPSGSVLDSVEGLFARLRQPVSTESDDAATPPPDEVRETPAPASSVAADGPDPFALRDELLLPIANRALRNLKRQLTEEQNAALESIRIDDAGWEPDAESLGAALRPDIVVLLAESFAAGHKAAEEMVGRELARPATPPDVGDAGLADALGDDLVKALADGRAHDHGARQLASDISRIYRAWRTDEAERRVRHLSFVAFNQGVAASLEGHPLRWVVAGRGCASCRDHGAKEATEPPPLHEGCACTIVPSDAG